MDFKNVVIYSDVDGTLANNNTGSTIVPTNNLEAIKRFIKQGGYFGVATGRASNAIKEMFKDVIFNMPNVQANGGCVYDVSADKIIYESSIETEIKDAIYQYVKSNKDLYIMTMDNVNSLKIYLGDERDIQNNYSFRPLIDYETYMKNNLVKVVVFNRKNNKKVEEDVLSLLNDKYIIVKSSELILEIIRNDVSKAQGIQMALKERQLEDKMLICLGDYENDIPMLKLADKSICPNDALDEVKQLVDYVSIEHDQGIMDDVLKYIERL